MPDLGPAAGRAERAFSAYWFGARSQPRVELLLANMRVRFEAYPEALAVLRSWPDMDPDTRALVCHWHLQLADPLYRAFTGELLPERRASAPGEITRACAALLEKTTGLIEDRRQRLAAAQQRLAFGAVEADEDAGDDAELENAEPCPPAPIVALTRPL